MKSNGKKLITTIAAISVTFFSLCSCVIAAVAWFSVANQAKTEGETFKVIAGGEGGFEIKNVNMYKFVYMVDSYGSGETAYSITDYLRPQRGEVCKYLYDNGFTKKYNQYVLNQETNEYYWTFETINPGVTSMNVFDPVDLIATSDTLIDLNCNVVYEISFSSGVLSSSKYLKVEGIWKSDKQKTSTSDIFLTDCLDFDFYTDSDIEDQDSQSNWNQNLYDTSGETPAPLYNPSYYNKLGRSLTDFEKTYYKISYLSSNDTHSNFYSHESKDNVVLKKNKVVTFDANGNCVLYINANYSSSQLEEYFYKVHKGNTKAIFDYAFNFNFSDEAVE